MPKSILETYILIFRTLWSAESRTTFWMRKFRIRVLRQDWSLPEYKSEALNMLRLQTQITSFSVTNEILRRNTWIAKSYNTSFSVNTQSWQCWHFCSNCNLNKLKIATVQFFVENFNWLREDVHRIGVFTNSPQHKNANIANFVLTLPLERNWTDEVCKLEMFTSTDI